MRQTQSNQRVDDIRLRAAPPPTSRVLQSEVCKRTEIAEHLLQQHDASPELGMVLRWDLPCFRESPL
jgi:hypothetical protein